MSQGNARRLTVAQDGKSGIPHPSSALKKRPVPDHFAAPPPASRPARVSVAPGAGGMRAPLGQTLSQSSSQPQPGPSTNLRMSMLRAPPQFAPQLSVSRGADRNPFGRTPVRNPTASVRKQAAYGVGRVSMAPMFAMDSTLKETRPLRDKAYQALLRNDIVQYLQQRQYTPLPTAKGLESPPTKDFTAIFQFLINDVLDPQFQWGRAGRKGEEDILILLKDHRYRAAGSISKSNLTAVGSLHTWPNVLGMLHWLVNVCQLKLQFLEYMEDNDPWLPAPVDGGGKPRADSNPETVIDDYIAATYRLYLSGEDQFPDQIQVLEDFFDRRSEVANAQAESDSVAANKAASELQLLKSKPTELEQLRSAVDEARKLKEQYNTGTETTQRKDVKLRKNLHALKETIEEANQKMQNLDQEEAALEAAIAAQPITAEEMQRMATETEKLQRTLRDVQTRIREATRANNSSEVTLSHRVHHLDGAVTEYNDILWRLGLYRRKQGAGADNSMENNEEGDEDAGEFEIELNPAANAVSDMLRGGGTLDGGLKNRVQPELAELANEARLATTELKEQKLAKDSEAEKVGEDVEHINDEADMLRRKNDIMQQKAEEIKGTTAKVTAGLREEIERLEREVASLGVGAQSALVSSQARLSAAEDEFKDIQYKTEQLKRQTHEDITKQTGLLLDFREQVTAKLEELRSSAEDE